MKRFGLLIVKYWYVLLLGLAIVAAILVKVLSAGKVKTELTPIRDAIRDADTGAKIEKAKVTAKTEVQKTRLDTIIKIEDGEERRKQLALLLEELDA